MRASFLTAAIMLGLAVASAPASGQVADSSACPDVGEVPLDELLRCQAGQQAARIDALLPDEAGGLSAQERQSLVLACANAALLGDTARQRCEARHLSLLATVARPDGLDALSARERLDLDAACADASEQGPAELRLCQARRLAEIRPQPAPQELPAEPAPAGIAAPLEGAPPGPAPEPLAATQLTAAEVTELQALLAEAGYDPGPVDGLFGPSTARAIERYERRAGRPATGLATAELLAALRDDAVPPRVAEPAAPQPAGDPIPPDAAEAIVVEELAAPPGPVAAEENAPEPAPAQSAQPEPSPGPDGPAEAAPVPQEPGEPVAVPQEPGEPVAAELEASAPDVGGAVDHPGSAELPAPAKDAVWMVAAGMDATAFENWAGLSRGSAVAVAEDRLLTDCRIVANFSMIYILQDESVASARIVSSEQDADRCVLAPTDRLLPSFVDIRSYRDLRIGEPVFTLANPSGIERVLGEGEISSLWTIRGVPYVETTAPAAPDSTGIGLFDAQGRLIGIKIRSTDITEQLNLAVAADSFGSE